MDHKNFSITLSSYGYHSSIKLGDYIDKQITERQDIINYFRGFDICKNKNLFDCQNKTVNGLGVCYRDIIDNNKCKQIQYNLNLKVIKLRLLYKLLTFMNIKSIHQSNILKVSSFAIKL